MTPARHPLATVVAFLTAPPFVTAMTSVIVGTSIMALARRETIAWPGLIAILSTLCLIAIISIVARWSTIEWRGILPISLLVFLGWAGLSLLWSSYTWVSLGSLVYLGCFTVLGLYIALLRDSIQIVRSYGDALRVVLVISISLEIVAGVLIDAPIGFLQILGDLDHLGPIQGISGSRNQLGIVSVIALITFATELRTKSVSRTRAIGSLILASVTLLLTQSPLGLGASVAVGLAAAALYGLRRVAPHRRRFWQLSLAAAAVILAIGSWISRSVIVQTVGADTELSYRLDLWRQTWGLISLYPLQGWGWIGSWRDDIPPYLLFQGVGPRSETSASNAYLDVWLQLGVIGLVIFLGLVGLAFTRSWLLASRQRSVVYAWPALVLVALATTGLAESSILVEFGWLTFVVCAVKAAEQLSWRRALVDD